MSNYPDGAANDPKAPYNQKDPKMTEWDECGYSVCEKCEEPHRVNEDGICEACFEPEEIDEEDLKAAEGDRAYDAWKDSRLEEE